MTNITSGTVLIWISQWEYQCCGNPIKSGDVVDLTVFPPVERDAWTHVVGRIALVAGHHVPPEDAYHLRVHVDRLMEARARREQNPADEVWRSEPGSEEVHEVPTMMRWEEDWQPAQHGAEPCGWILEATILAELPPRADDLPYGLNPKLGRVVPTTR